MRITQWLRWASAAALVLGSVLSAEAQEIKFWTLTFDNPDVTKAFNTIIKDFEAANPGVTVKMENRATDEHKSALRVAAGSDQAPDIYFMWAGLGLGGEFIKSGLALPMDKYYAQYKWDDEFIGPALSFSKQYAGGRFGLPYTFRGEALYYNKAFSRRPASQVCRRPMTNSSPTPTNSPPRAFRRSPSGEPSTGISCG